MYTGRSQRGLGATVGPLPPILSLVPSPLPAGPGPQVVVVRGTGLAVPFNLAIVPDDDRQLTNRNTQGGGPLYAVSADGTTAKAVIDLAGNVTTWQARLISPYTTQVSPWFPVRSVAGAVPPFDQQAYAVESGQATPILVIADTVLAASRNAQGQVTNHVIVTGGNADVPQIGGGIINQKFPGPGLLVDQGGTWQFIPAAQAAAIVVQRFGNVVPQCAGSAIGRDLVDPFGLPIVTPQCPGSLSWVDTQGNAVTSPWSTGAVPQPGSPIVTVRPTPAPTLYQSPTAPPPPPVAPAASVSRETPPSPMPPYQAPVTGPAVTAAPPVTEAMFPPLYQSPPVVGPSVDLAPAPPPPSPGVSAGGLWAAVVLIGGGLAYASYHRGRR